MRLGVIVGLVAVTVGGLLYFGVISRRDISTTGRRAVADVKKIKNEIVAPVVEASEADIQAARTCRENLKRLESAKRAVADRRGQSTGAVSWDEVLQTMGARKAPVCPAGGSYSLNKLGTAATCSIGPHGTSTKSDDHVIQSF